MIIRASYVRGRKQLTSTGRLLIAAKVGQDNVNIGVVTIFRLANTSLLQVY